MGSRRPSFFRCCRPRYPVCSPGHTTHIGFREFPATLVTYAGWWSLQHYCANWRENYDLAAIRRWHWNIVRLFVLEEIFCTVSEQQIRSPPNRRLQSLNMRSARCLILSHQVHLQSQIHCWIGRSPHQQTTPLERGRVPNMYLTADEGTTVTINTHSVATGCLLESWNKLLRKEK